MTSVNALAEELESRVYMQRTEKEFTFEEYMDLIVRAIRRLYVDTGRALIFSKEMFIDSSEEGDLAPSSDEPSTQPTDDQDPAADGEPTSDTDPAAAALFFSADLKIDEEEYVLLCAEKAFLEIIQKDVNVITSYTTNALSVTGADKPYAHLADSIDKLENYRRELLYRMIRYMKGVSY